MTGEDTSEDAYKQILETLTYNPSVETDNDGSATLDASSEPDTNSDDVTNLVQHDEDGEDTDDSDKVGGIGKE